MEETTRTAVAYLWSLRVPLPREYREPITDRCPVVQCSQPGVCSYEIPDQNSASYKHQRLVDGRCLTKRRAIATLRKLDL